jgi:hypothetical protein
MKKLLLSLLAVPASFFVFSQNILVVNNNAGAPTGSHVYSTLQAAIDATVAGDIIHVIPSPNTYGTATIDAQDSISIYGIGIKPDKDGPALSTAATINIYGSGIKISGLNLSSVFLGASNKTVNNVAIENCSIANISSTTTSTFNASNILIRNCIINNSGNSSATIDLSNRISNSVITNCILIGYFSTSNVTTCGISAYNGCIIKNCIFIGDGESNKYAFTRLENCSVVNNIFFGRTTQAGISYLNVSFNNNIAVGSTNNNLPPQNSNGVTGNNNFTTVTDATTVFANPSIVIGDAWDLNWEPKLSATTEVLLGTDGTKIGPVGSTIAWNSTGVSLPLIQSVITSEVIKQGDDLEVKIKARGN